MYMVHQILLVYHVDCTLWEIVVEGFFINITVWFSAMFTYAYNRSVRKCPLVVIIGRFRSKLIQGLTCTSLPGEVVPSVNLNKKPFHTRRYYYLCCTTIFDFKMPCNACSIRNLNPIETYFKFQYYARFCLLENVHVKYDYVAILLVYWKIVISSQNKSKLLSNCQQQV